MLSNVKWFWKFTGALLVFAILCADAAWRIPGRYPHFSKVLASPDAWDGKRIWVAPSPVVAVAEDHMVVESRGAQIKVMSKERWQTGTWLYAVGTFHRDGTVTPERIRKAESWQIQRGTIYGISLAVVLAWIWFFLKRLKPTLRGIAPRVSTNVTTVEDGPPPAA
jgi:hypothetical protein